MGGIFWLASYPKSGNTWLRAWLTSLRTTDSAPAAFGVTDEPIASSRLWLDTTLGFDTADLGFEEIDRLRPAIHAWPPPCDGIRLHKVHDAYTRPADGAPMFGGGATLGAIYLVRNPLDVAVSYAAHAGRPIDRVIAFMADPAHGHAGHPDRLALQVRQHLGSWSDHVASWTDAEDIAVQVVRYEDMHAAPAATLARAARFVRLPADPARVGRAVEEARFERMQAHERVHGFAERPPGMAAFFRQGRAGAWREHLSPAQIARILDAHGPTMQRFGYLDAGGNPV